MSWRGSPRGSSAIEYPSTCVLTQRDEWSSALRVRQAPTHSTLLNLWRPQPSEPTTPRNPSGSRGALGCGKHTGRILKPLGTRGGTLPSRRSKARARSRLRRVTPRVAKSAASVHGPALTAGSWSSARRACASAPRCASRRAASARRASARQGSKVGQTLGGSALRAARRAARRATHRSGLNSR